MKSTVATWYIAVSLAAGAVYLYLSFRATTASQPTGLGALLGLAPIAAATLAFAWKSRVRLLALALCGAAAAALALEFDELRRHTQWLYFLQHIGVMGALAFTFGTTLGGGDARALCSRLALAIREGEAAGDAGLMRYTRRLTAVWTAFFVLCACVSVALFAWAPIGVWSIFADVLTPAMLAAMFVGEYLVRLCVLPARDHVSIGRIVRAYVADARARKRG